MAREVGTEGKLGGQAEVEDVSGTWRGLTENVNMMASNLTDQVRNIAQVTTAVANGDLSKKITVDAKGEILELKETINTMVDQLNSFAAEVTRVAREVGTEGKLGGQAEVEGVSGTWRGLTENVNMMASNLTDQVRNIALVTTAVANGDLSKKITADAKGEILELKNTINTMVDQLTRSRPRSRAWPARWAPRASSAARPRSRACRAPGAASPSRELDGVQPHRPGAQHRPGYDGGGPGRPHPEDHRRRQGRDPRAQAHDQHDGGPALELRRRGHARGARGGHRGQARRPGSGRGRVRHVARPHRERERPRHRPSPPSCARSRRCPRR